MNVESSPGSFTGTTEFRRITRGGAFSTYLVIIDSIQGHDVMLTDHFVDRGAAVAWFEDPYIVLVAGDGAETVRDAAEAMFEARD